MKSGFRSVFIAISLLATTSILLSWGTWGHQHINHAAVFALPDSMRRFFYNHIDFVTEESVVPDVRKYAISDKAEFNRHFVDLESFVKSPSDTLPSTMAATTAKYDAKFLDQNGILPWYIMDMMQKLTKAFQDKKKAETLFLAADLAHYIGDAHMPLHTSLNHDGQLTNQRGIHSFFESQLPEQFGESYNFYTGNAVYVPNVQKEVMRIIEDSHRLVDTLLLTERKVHDNYDTGKIYVKDPAGNYRRNKYGVPIRTFEYASAYHTALNGMVEKQLRAATAATANFWYTAWVNAGRPNLDSMEDPALTERNRKNYKKEYQLWKEGKLFGFKIDREY